MTPTTPTKVIDFKMLLAKWGPGWLLAGVLVYFLMNSIAAAQSNVLQQVVDMSTTLKQHMADMKDDAARADYRLQRLEMIMRALCVNGARTPQQIATCQEASK